MSAATPWTDAEYARVARALLYPVRQQARFSAEYFGSHSQIPLSLGFVLQDIAVEQKPTILAMADSVEADQLEYFRSAKKSPQVSQVGSIKLDVGRGLQVRAQAIEAQRDVLASRIPFDVNPDATRLTGGGGGMNATWSP